MGLESYGGVNIFGSAVRIHHTPRPNAVQADSMFGANGTLQLSGGSRGRDFEITGVLEGATLTQLLAAEALFLSYADGIARILVDPIGREFFNVVFNGEYSPDPSGNHYTDGGVCLPYRAVFHGLT